MTARLERGCLPVAFRIIQPQDLAVHRPSPLEVAASLWSQYMTRNQGAALRERHASV